MPADLLSVQPTHRHQRPGCDFDVEELVRVTGPLDGIPGDTKRKNTTRVKRQIKKTNCRVWNGVFKIHNPVCVCASVR